MAETAPSLQDLIKTYPTQREAQAAVDSLNLTRPSVYGKYEVRLDGAGFAVRWRNFNI